MLHVKIGAFAFFVVILTSAINFPEFLFRRNVYHRIPLYAIKTCLKCRKRTETKITTIVYLNGGKRNTAPPQTMEEYSNKRNIRVHFHCVFLG